MKFKMKKNNLRIVSFLLALLMVVNSVPLPARADVEAFVETFAQKTEDFNYSAASPSEAEKVCGYCGEIDCENECILCEDCGKENCICDLDVASPSEAVKVCEDCGADPCECEICEECEKDPCECNNTKKLMLFTTAKSQTKEFDLNTIWASASNAVYNSYEDEYKIGFVDDENDSLVVFGKTSSTKVSVSDSPGYFVLLGEYVNEEDESVLMYEIDSFDDDFYFNVLVKQANNYVEPDALAEIVEAEELYVKLKENEDITLWSDLSVATNICTVEAGELDGSYSVEALEFASVSGGGEWFVKLEQSEEWPEKAEGYVWLRAACIFDFVTEAEEETEVKPNPYIPINPSVPVIPENPELPEGVEVPILDENGEVITEEGKQLVAGTKATLSAWSDLGEDVSYQWQVCYDVEENLWVDIYKANGKGLLVSQAMFISLADEDGQVLVRCITSDGDETSVSEPIPVILVDETDEKELVASAYVKARNTEVLAATETGTEQYYITIKYQFTDGTTSAQTQTFRLSKGSSYDLDVISPTVNGYYPDKERITESITNIEADISYIVTYFPSEMNFTVNHLHQNITGNDYSVVKTETKTGITGVPVGSALEKSYAGFYSLLYDETIKIAPDGSTVINIYYDRYYYFLNVDQNGGHGVEPIYARYETNVNKNSMQPIKAGYEFAGWSPELPEMIIANTTHAAQWSDGIADFTVVYWYENANDSNYSYAGHSYQKAKTGTQVKSSEYAEFEDHDKTHFKNRNTSKDETVTVAGDGSTTLNVYFYRNTYTLTFLQCKTPVHEHYANTDDHGCLANMHSNEEASGSVKNHLDGEYQNAYSGFYCNYPLGLINRYYVYLRNNSGGYTWWRMKDSTPSYDCGYENHSHSFSCYPSSEPSPTDTTTLNKYTYVQKTYKWQQDVSKYWGQEGAGGRAVGTRWHPYTTYDASGKNIYNSGTGVGLMISMPDTNVTFRWHSNGSVYCTMNYYVEPVSGTGSKTFDGGTFNRLYQFYAYFGAITNLEEYIDIAGFTKYKKRTFDELVAMGEVVNGSETSTGNFYYSRNSYDLTFMSNAEVVNTVSYKYQASISPSQGYVPSVPEEFDSNAYKFGGWYTTKDCVPGTEVDWNSTMPLDGLILYANWSTDVVRTVTTSLEKDAAVTNTYTVLHGNTVSSPPANPTKDGYRFVAWFYEENGVEKAYTFSMPVTKNLELYAKWVSDSLAESVIKYMIVNTNTQIADPMYSSGLIGSSKTFDAKAGNDLYEDYREGYFPIYNSHTVEFQEEEDLNNYTFYYIEKAEVGYEIQYLEKGTEKELHEPTVGTSKRASITAEFIPIDHYAADAFSKELVLSSDDSLNVLVFYYEKDEEHAPVQIVHKKQNVVGEDYTDHLTKTPFSGVIGTSYSEDALEIPGFRLNSELSVMSGTLTNAGLLLELYYDRIEYPYEFRYMEQGTNKELKDVEGGFARYQAQETKIGPHIDGYSLVSAGTEIINIAIEDDLNKAVKNVRTFYYTEDTATITYEIKGDVNSGILSVEEEILQAVNGEAKGSTITVKEDYKFEGWYLDSACNDLYTSDETISPRRVGGIWVDSIYYAKTVEKMVSIHYKIVGYYGNLSVESEQVNILNGKARGSNITLSDPDHYKVVGWFDNENCSGAALSTDSWYVPKLNDGEKWVDGTTYYAKVVEQKAEINYVAIDTSGMNEGKVTPTSEGIDMATGTAEGSTASTDSPMHEFAGWYSDATCTTQVGANANYVPSKEDDEFWEDTTYYAKFQLKTFTISFEPGDGTMADNDSITYKYGDNVTLPEVTKEGHTAVWVVKDDSGSWKKDVEVKSGTINDYGNVTLVPQWTPKKYYVLWVNYDFMDNFDINNPQIGNALWYQQVEYNTVPPAYGGTTPTRPDENGMRYTFTGWDKDVTVPITNHTIYVAQYTSAPIYTKLTIETKDGNPNQNYVFTVTGTPKNKTLFGDSITLRVAVIGNSSVTIQDLPAGTYIVQEKGSWAWRQLVLGDKDAELDGDTPSATVTFNYGPEEQLYWLNGYNYNRKKGVSN